LSTGQKRKLEAGTSFPGDEPPDVYSAGMSVLDAIYGDFPSDTIEKWIRSLVDKTLEIHQIRFLCES